MSSLVRVKNVIFKYATYATLILVAYAIIQASYKLSYQSDLLSLAASIQDDSFYYLTPAYNFSHGLGFTFGGEKSYGFQPGYEIFLTLLGWFLNSREALLRLAVFSNSVLFVSTGVVVYFLVKQFGSSYIYNKSENNQWRICALMAALVYLSNSWNYFNSITVKENPLSAFLLAVLIFLLILKKEEQDPKLPVIAGFISGALLLTRISPSTCLYLVGALWIMRDSYKSFLIALAAMVLPWASFAYIYFGSAVPFSALVKAASPTEVFDFASASEVMRYWLTSIKFGVFGPSKVMLSQPNWIDALRDDSMATLLYVIATVSLASLVAEFFSKLRANTRGVGICIFTIIATTVGAILMGAALVLKGPAGVYYSSWYFFDSPVIYSFAIGCGLIVFINSLSANRRYLFQFLEVCILGLTVVIAYCSVDGYSKIRPYDKDSLMAGVGVRWPNTMIAAGLWYKNNVAGWQKYRVVAYSAGALNFVLEDKVINIDGLANDNVAHIIMDRKPALIYIENTKPDYFIDVGAYTPENEHIHLRRIHTLDFPDRNGYQISQFSYTSQVINR